MFKKAIRSVITLILIAVLLIPLFPTTAHAAYENTYKNTGNMRDDIIGVALTQVGYKEGSNNYTKYGVWYGQPNSPWCGMFVSWCAKQAGIPTSVMKRTGIANPKNFGLSYKSGSEYTPQKGDLFFKKNFSHVGIVYYTSGSYFYTIEGNTSTTSSNGDSVQIRKRKISDFYFSSPNYSGSSSNSGCDHTYKTKVESAHPHKEYKICTKCDRKTYTGSKKTDDSCKTCIQANCKHTYGEWKNSSDTKHTRVCTKCEIKKTEVHNWKLDKVLSPATCVNAGKQQMICADCGAETTKKIEATGEHQYGDFVYIDESSHSKICQTCDKKITAKHNASKNWQHDIIYHWTSCADCSGRIQHSEHSFPDGCLAPCKTCGYTIEDGHKLTGTLISSEESHWEVCERCGLKANENVHTYTSDCDEICNDCGFHRGASAEHQDTFHADETGHWRICSACARVTDVVSHTEDQAAADWQDQLCTDCGFILRSKDNHIHTHDTVAFDDNTHWGTCACGEELLPEVHIWDFQTNACSICGAENIPDQTSGNFLTALINLIFG